MRINQKADLVLLGGKIITVDKAFTIAQAVAVKNGIIIGVGSDKEIGDLIGTDTEVLNLEGKAVVPGFIDSHMHPLIYGMDLLKVQCGTPPNNSIAEVLEQIRKAVEKAPVGTWINCASYKPLLLKDKRMITRWDLDQVAPHHPVQLQSSHAVTLNSRGLELAGITKETPDPEGGRIEKDPDTGEPTGTVLERAVKSVMALIPPPPRKDYSRALDIASKAFLEEGVTSVHEAGVVEEYENKVLLRAYQDSLKAGALHVRAYVMMTIHSPKDLKEIKEFGFYTGFGNDKVRIGPAKLYVDGALSTKSIAIYPPPIEGSLGSMEWQKGELNEVVKELHRMGWQICAHAQGDRGIDFLLDAYQAAIDDFPRPNHRHRVEHSGITTPSIQKRYKEMGIVAASQPNFVHFLGSNIQAYGLERARWMYPFKSLVDQGIVVSGGSDLRATPFSALLGIWCAVNRLQINGEVLIPEERISVKDALRLFTINGAYASFEEDVKGSIESGKYADMVVLDQDLLSTEVDQLRNIKVLFTILAGEIVFRR